MKKVILFLLIVALVFSFASCNVFHNHEWQNYLIIIPTCTTQGVLRQLCIDCGEVELIEISPLQHNFVDGVCSECNTTATAPTKLARVPVPSGSDNAGQWTLYEIYTIACGLKYSGTYSDFTSSVSGIAFKKASVSNSNTLKMTAICQAGNTVLETPLVYTVKRVTPVYPHTSIGVLLRADIVNSELFLTYTNGLEISAGKFNNKNDASITGFGINKDNELVIYYSDNTLAFAGTFNN